MEYNWEYVFNHWIPPGNIIASGYIFVASFEIYILLIFKFKRRIYALLSCNSNSEENNEYLYLIIHLEI